MQTSYHPSYGTFIPAFHLNGNPAVSGIYPAEDIHYRTGDERFFGFGILPFVAGLAIGPLLFNRPCCPPPFSPYPYPPPPFPPPYYAPVPYPSPPVYNQQNITPVYGGLTENINIMANAPAQGR